MTTITCLADLDRAVAEAAFCPEPPLSERRAIHESGAWRWNPEWTGCTRVGCRPGRDRGCMSEAMATNDCPALHGHWEPAPFATDPAASYALEEKMRERFRKGWWQMRDTSGLSVGIGWRVTFTPMVGNAGYVWHESRLIAMCLAALRALGVELELREGWDAR